MVKGEHLVEAAVDGDIRLEPYKLPAESLIAGDPRPRMWSVTRADGNGYNVVSGIFEADPGTIRNPIRATETIHVVRGRVLIELDTGESVELGAGQMAVLPRGPVATWTFLEPFKELFVLSGVQP